MTILKDALDFLFKRGAESTSAEKKVHVTKIDSKNVVIVKGKDIVDHIVLTSRHGDLCSLHAVNSFIAGCVEGRTDVSVVQKCVNLNVSVSSEGADWEEPVVRNCTVEFTDEYKLLFNCQQNAIFFAPHEFIRIVKTGQFGIDNQAQVLAAVDKLVWKSQRQNTQSGVGQSRASYGDEVTQEVEANDVPELSDVVCNIKLTDDPACPVSEKIKCFFEFDHDNCKIAITPYGGELDRLLRRGVDVVNSFIGSANEDANVYFA